MPARIGPRVHNDMGVEHEYCTTALQGPIVAVLTFKLQSERRARSENTITPEIVRNDYISHLNFTISWIICV